MKKSEYLTIGKKAYTFNIEKLRSLCKGDDEGGIKQTEISQEYEAGDNGEISIVSKVEHETRTVGNIQNKGENSLFEIYKYFMLTLASCDLEDLEKENNLGITLSFNTLLNSGILEIIE